MRKADSVAESASVLVKRTMREIRGELANLSTELNLAGSASDREKVYGEIRRRMALLSRRMNKLMEAQNELAARSAAASASKMTGLEVKYSPKRAEAITELVTPAQGENLAAVFTDRMGRNLINSLREATVGMLREQAVAGGSMKDMARDLAARWSQAAKVDDPRFTDASGRTWDTRTYIQMNVRTNTMRVYNDCLLDDVAREVGTDLMRISSGGDPDCDCAAWEGVIISVSGQTKGLPTYEDARNAGCFHPNCTHTLEYVDEVADKKEIELQKAHPVQEGLADDPDAQDERKYEIDQARYMRDNPGMTQEEARIAVDRDNLAASIQSGLVRDDAREIVAKMTDAQVTALCPDGNPPRFEPVKRVRGGTRKEPKYEPERWNRGRRGGVVHVARDADDQRLLEVCGADRVTAPQPPAPTRKPMPPERKPVSKESLMRLAIRSVKDIQAKDFDLKEDELGVAEEAISALNRHLADLGLKRFTKIEFHRNVDWNASVRFGAIKFNIDRLKDAKTRWDKERKDAESRGGRTELVLGERENAIDTIVVHELGHWAQMANNRYKEIGDEYKRAKRNTGKLPSVYAKTNEMEFFAECFTQYHVDRSKLTESQRRMVELVKEGIPAKRLQESARLIERTGKSDGETISLPPISRETAEAIRKVSGVAPTSLTPTVGGDEIRHTFNRHGKHVDGLTKGETQKNQVPITADDIARIGTIINEYDSLSAGSFNETENAPSVKFQKKMEDGTVNTVFVVADSLTYKTMWKKK